MALGSSIHPCRIHRLVRVFRFARESLNIGRVSMPEYCRYCDADADADAAPLYIFDPDILTRMHF